MIIRPLTMAVVTVVMAIAIVLGALAVHGIYNPSYQLPDSASEMLQSVVPGEVLS